MMSAYEFVSRSDRAVQIREFWNRLFASSDLPDGVRKDIRGRFANKSDEQHYGALFELLTHELLGRHGYTVACETELPNGKMPDFLVTAPSGERFYWESTAIVGPLREWLHDDRSKDLYDYLCKIKSPLFRAQPELDGTPRWNGKELKKIRRRVEEWMNGLDYNEMVRHAREKSTFPREDIALSIDVGGATLTLEPFLADLYGREVEGSFIKGISYPYAYYDPTTDNIRNKLRAKSVQLRDVNRPSVVAIDICHTCLAYEDLVDALFGGQRDTYTRRNGKAEYVGTYRGQDGAWFHDGSSRNTKISAVAVFPHLLDDAAPTTQPFMIINPYIPDPDIPEDLPFMRYIRLEQDSTENVFRIPEIERMEFGWMKNWPYQPKWKK